MRAQLCQPNRFVLILISALLLPSATFAQNLLKGPQKAVIDTKRNRLIVSNYDSGDLVQIDSTGKQTYFVQGANFVDGLEIVGDTLYGVGNTRKIRAYNLETKELFLDYSIPGPAYAYLSSITSDSAGTLFISCPQSNKIYLMSTSGLPRPIIWEFASNNGLNKPNGILLEKEKKQDCGDR